MRIINLSDRTNMFYWQTNRPLSAEQTKKIFIDRYRANNFDQIKLAAEFGMEKTGLSGKDIKVKEFKNIIKHGSVNTVIPLVMESGLQIILRVHPKKVKNGYFWVEKVATSLVKKHGVPTYSTLFVDDTQTIVPFDFMIISKEPGEPISDLKDIDQSREKRLITETGKLAALIHSVKPKGFGFFKNEIAKKQNILVGQYQKFKEHIYAALDEDLKYLVDHKVFNDNEIRLIEKKFSQNENLMLCGQPVLIHNDIADWNQLTDGKQVIGIMDWDECFAGDPLMELAAYSLFYGEPRLIWFKEGYNSIKKLEYDEKKFQLFKLRYLVSKMHLRKKRSTIDPSPGMKRNIERGLQAMKEVFKFFTI